MGYLLSLLGILLHVSDSLDLSYLAVFAREVFFLHGSNSLVLGYLLTLLGFSPVHAHLRQFLEGLYMYIIEKVKMVKDRFIGLVVGL
jgi:hypothetical protein